MPLEQPSPSAACGGPRTEPDTPAEDLLDEALEETYPDSDPFAPAQRAGPKIRSDS